MPIIMPLQLKNDSDIISVDIFRCTYEKGNGIILG